jgi:hypothetical protein
MQVCVCSYGHALCVLHVCSAILAEGLQELDDDNLV